VTVTAAPAGPDVGSSERRGSANAGCKNCTIEIVPTRRIVPINMTEKLRDNYLHIGVKFL